MRRALPSTLVGHGPTIALGVATILFLATAAFALVVRSVRAYHLWNPGVHLTVQHFADAYEEDCVY